MSKPEHAQHSLQNLIDNLHEVVMEGGDRVADLLTRASVRDRIDELAEKIDELRLEIARSLRDDTPLARPLEELSVEDLHELATNRHIEGRSSMNKAELVDALR